jgi:type I restriction enzyme S subunit
VAYSVSNLSGLIPQNEQFEESSYDNLDKSSYKIVEANEFAYNPARINVGSIAYNNLGKPVIVSSLYVIFKMNSQIDNNFILQYIKSSDFLKEVRKNTEGSVREYLFFDNFSNIRFPFPSDINEQQKIGQFLHTLDNLIAFHQRKLELMKQMKKGLLQKIFSQELRFEGFGEEWEEEKLGKLLITYGLKDFLAETESNGHNPIIQQGDIPIIGYSNKNPFKHFENIVLFGDHTLSLYKPIQPFLVATDGIKILSINNWDGNFLFSFLEELLPSSEGYKRHFSILKNQIGKFPENIQEQQIVGKFFQNFDSQINFQSQKLTQLQSLKKSLLQKMFV